MGFKVRILDRAVCVPGIKPAWPGGVFEMMSSSDQIEPYLRIGLAHAVKLLYGNVEMRD